MGRGKIEIKKIENSTNRQVTYSKRRAGIFKKAKELTVLCDAEVSLIMFSNTGKLSEFKSPSLTLKNVYDRYQQNTGIDLWQSHYEKMQENLNKQKELNNKLRREIGQRTGEDISSLTLADLRGLEQDLDTSLRTVRERKYHQITTQTDTYRKKWRNVVETHNNLLNQLEVNQMTKESDYHLAIELANAGSPVVAFRLQPNQPNLHDEGYGLRDLRLS